MYIQDILLMIGREQKPDSTILLKSLKLLTHFDLTIKIWSGHIRQRDLKVSRRARPK